ncbi:type II secretion system protein G (GspG) [Pseudoxanthomonas wuyuanensis]|uniref:Type II secretion system protein G (GspG) n=2 Tax=Pseudoxanthomonas wuyuanensis TaxID=1073196 RepID=A0A286CZ27_9GAMM|nr:prepilin-type N-terminal cleavage/methylation domain-containing protein [Pseudoxanthomonas wuyuanensis]SOD51624.1 type II secretion system protein G (GspG) [Pseudoxanthomonas wuyuanensis]
MSRGFSLIELIVVVAIIALLLVVALPRYQSSLDRAEFVALSSSLRTMRESIDRFHEDKGRYPQNLEELVEEKYLREIPLDPITDSKTTWLPMEDTSEGRGGMSDVRSGAKGVALNGVSYTNLAP